MYYSPSVSCLYFSTDPLATTPNKPLDSLRNAHRLTQLHDSLSSLRPQPLPSTMLSAQHCMYYSLLVSRLKFFTDPLATTPNKFLLTVCEMLTFLCHRAFNTAVFFSSPPPFPKKSAIYIFGCRVKSHQLLVRHVTVKLSTRRSQPTSKEKKVAGWRV